jgi:hypothetical protein
MIKQVAADFFHPVLELYPHLSAEYLAAVREPMDLQTLYYLLFEVQLQRAPGGLALRGLY